jgi:hypothetical protein
MFQQTRRATISALLVGATILGAGGAALDGHAIALARASQPSSAAAKHPLARNLLKLAKLRRQVLTVDSVTGSTIAATTRAGAAITIATSATTTFTEAGSTVTIAAVQPKEHLLVGGTVDRATHTIQAKKVTIVVPAISGVVTNVTGSSITFTGRNAIQHTVTIPAGAKIEQAGQNATMQAITVGSVVTVQGTTGAGGTFTVLRVVIRLPRVAGTITAVNGASFTLRTAAGATYAVTTSPTTSYTVRQRGVAAKPSTTAPAITAGERAIVAGTLSPGSTTLAAVRVILAPAAKQAAASTSSTTGA